MSNENGKPDEEWDDFDEVDLQGAIPFDIQHVEDGSEFEDVLVDNRRMKLEIIQLREKTRHMEDKIKVLETLLAVMKEGNLPLGARPLSWWQMIALSAIVACVITACVAYLMFR